jgi:hypothetical protein
MKVFGLTIGEREATSSLSLGAHPSVDLLPPEVRIARRSRGMRRGVIATAVLIVLAVVAGGAFAKMQWLAAEVTLAAEESRTQALLDRQAEFGGVLAMQAELEAREAARQVVMSTEIDWQSIIAAITATLPEDATLVSVSAEGGSPMEAYAQAQVPLQGARVATVAFTVHSDALLSVPDIEDQLAGVLGFVDVQVPSATELAEGEGFETAFVLHLGEAAYSGRFPPDEAAETGQPAAPADATADADADAEGEEQQ